MAEFYIDDMGEYMDADYVSLWANVTGTNITQHYYPSEGSKKTDIILGLPFWTNSLSSVDWLTIIYCFTELVLMGLDDAYKYDQASRPVSWPALFG